MKFHAAAVLTLMVLPSRGLGKHHASGTRSKYPEDERGLTYEYGNHLGSNVGVNPVLKKNLDGDVRTYMDNYTAEYEPPESEMEDRHEATLAMPSSVAGRLFRQGGPFMEVEYGVSPSPDGTMVVVTFKGTTRDVEYCRAEMKDLAASAWMHLLDWKKEALATEIMYVPEELLATLRAGDRETRMEEWQRLNDGAEIEVSEGPDSADPAVRTVTISGGEGRNAERRALYGAYHLFKAMEKAVAEQLDRITLGVWRLVRMDIDPERKEFILGEGGSNMKKLVGRTGCRVQLSNMANRYMLADQEIWITGPEDEANEATREIMRLAAEDGLSKAPVA